MAFIAYVSYGTRCACCDLRVSGLVTWTKSKAGSLRDDTWFATLNRIFHGGSFASALQVYRTTTFVPFTETFHF